MQLNDEEYLLGDRLLHCTSKLLLLLLSSTIESSSDKDSLSLHPTLRHIVTFRLNDSSDDLESVHYL